LTDYDVIVVGSGPAGSMAAWKLAQAGLHTLLVERHILPRHKTCGGGMPMVAGDLLEFPHLRDLAPDAFVELTISEFRCTYKFSNEHLLSICPQGSTDKGIWMVQRSVFDYALAKRAESAGATLKDGARVVALQADGSAGINVGITLAGNTEQVRARYVIGADGANGVVARLAGLKMKRSIAIAAEAEVPYDWDSCNSIITKNTVHLEFGDISGGYSWMFPKANHLNVGAGLFSEHSPHHTNPQQTRKLLEEGIIRYLNYTEVPFNPDELRIHFHPLPLWNGRHTLQNKPATVLLAGDAAGLVNPIFGDGILHALRSGEIAARCIAKGNAAAYTRTINEHYQNNFDSALRLARLFYRWPEFAYNLSVPRPGAGQIALRLLSGEALFTGLTRRMVRRIASSVTASTKGHYDRANN
jgi:geranylgeranyl reductase family protein